MQTITLLRVENARSGRGIYQDMVAGVYDDLPSGPNDGRPMPDQDDRLVSIAQSENPVAVARQRWGDAQHAFASMTQLLRWWKHTSLQRMRDDGARLCVYVVPCDRAIVGNTQVLFDPASVIATYELGV